MVNFYKLRLESTHETIAKHDIDCKVSKLKVFYSCLYDILFFKTIYNKHGYIVYMQNSYFNVGFDCCTILKSFTTKRQRCKSVYYNLRKQINCDTLLEIKESNGQEPNVLGYIQSVY